VLLEIEPTCLSGRTATGSDGRDGNEAVAGAASEAFVRWLRLLIDAVINDESINQLQHGRPFQLINGLHNFLPW